ncbi:hypothetical protein ABZP36_000404 [Zizania latifolia]
MRGAVVRGVCSFQTQLSSVYNVLNSQLAAAEQLSDCLSKQISALNITISKEKSSGSPTIQVKSPANAKPEVAFQPPAFLSTPVVQSSSNSIKSGASSSATPLLSTMQESAAKTSDVLSPAFASIVLSLESKLKPSPPFLEGTISGSLPIYHLFQSPLRSHQLA